MKGLIVVDIIKEIEELNETRRGSVPYGNATRRRLTFHRL